MCGLMAMITSSFTIVTKHQFVYSIYNVFGAETQIIIMCGELGSSKLRSSPVYYWSVQFAAK